MGARGSGRCVPQAPALRDHGHRSFSAQVSLAGGVDGARQAISGACGVADSPLAPSFPLPFPARFRPLQPTLFNHLAPLFRAVSLSSGPVLLLVLPAPGAHPLPLFFSFPLFFRLSLFLAAIISSNQLVLLVHRPKQDSCQSVRRAGLSCSVLFVFPLLCSVLYSNK